MLPEKCMLFNLLKSRLAAYFIVCAIMVNFLQNHKYCLKKKLFAQHCKTETQLNPEKCVIYANMMILIDFFA